jgi:hypothetical protein
MNWTRVTMTPRTLTWIAAALLAIFRPGIDVIDRALAGGAWRVPSEWNAVAHSAIRTGVVGTVIDGRTMPWRHASIVELRGTRLAAIVVSDFRTSRVTFVDERYRVRGVLRRVTDPPAVATDELRGYKPLSHVWPLSEQDGRLLTLISSVPLVSMPPSAGVFSYVALGSERNEVLFVCRLTWAPGPFWGVLDRADVDGDGHDDFVVRAPADARGFGRRDVPPVATFVWDAHTGEYVPHLTPEAAPIVKWWSTRRDVRLLVPRDEPIDDAIGRLPLASATR